MLNEPRCSARSVFQPAHSLARSLGRSVDLGESTVEGEGGGGGGDPNGRPLNLM